jgi:hypothetical protein
MEILKPELHDVQNPFKLHELQFGMRQNDEQTLLESW